MSERRRKNDKDRVSVNCKISAECKLELINLAGEMSLGWAIEDLIKRHLELRNTTASLPQLDSQRKIQ